MIMLEALTKQVSPRMIPVFMLSRLINLPVVTIDPLFGYDRKKVDMGKRKLEPISGIAVATGLALRDESPDA